MTTLIRTTEARLQTSLNNRLAEIAHDASVGGSGGTSEAGTQSSRCESASALLLWRQ